MEACQNGKGIDDTQIGFAALALDVTLGFVGKVLPRLEVSQLLIVYKR